MVRPKNAPTISLVYKIYLAVICLLRVYALYDRSRRILGLLLFLGLGAVFSTMVGRFPLTLIHVTSFFLSIKVTLFLARKAGGETIPVIPLFASGGCAHFTPRTGYVTDP